MLPKFLMGAIFALGVYMRSIFEEFNAEPVGGGDSGLHFIVIFGGELFTGAIMMFGVGKPFHPSYMIWYLTVTSE